MHVANDAYEFINARMNANDYWVEKDSSQLILDMEVAPQDENFLLYTTWVGVHYVYRSKSGQWTVQQTEGSKIYYGDQVFYKSSGLEVQTTYYVAVNPND